MCANNIRSDKQTSVNDPATNQADGLTDGTRQQPTGEAADDTTANQPAPEETVIEEVAQEKTTVEESPAEEPCEEIVIEEPTEETVIEEPSEETVIEETVAEEINEEEPSEETVIEEPTEETVIEETVAEEINEEEPSEETVIEEPTEETVIEEPSEETVNEGPSEETVNEGPSEEILEEVPMEEANEGYFDIEYDEDYNKGKPLVVALVALAILAMLSQMPWSEMTNRTLKNFNLLSDIFPSEADSIVGGDEFIDPELLALMDGDSLLNPMPMPGIITLPNSDDSLNMTKGTSSEAIIYEDYTNDNMPLSQEARVNGKMVIEDYTPGNRGLFHLKSALARRATRPVRIGVIGDSYIEGDIFTSDIRRLMQSKYGGHGVGYMAAHSQVAGFRPTVKHTSSGWTQHDVKEASRSKYFTLAGEYYTGSKGATITFKGVDNISGLKAWNTSRLVFIAPAAGTITLEGDCGTQTYDIQPSDNVQSITLNGETSVLKVTNNVAGLILFGVWLEDADGVVVDCMSVRGDSGVNRRGINAQLATDMRQYTDYDLIVVEYGINALTSKQRDYSMYGNTMSEVVKHIRQCYPNADIILMGIGDRGQKINGEAQSFATAANMVEAQREAARKAGVLFYDTRESMGGDGAIVNWRNQKLANGDYIHLNFNGGKVLAETFVDALIRKIGE